ncbi:MAG: hypothetical protein H6581_13845 [Bacteroidia bacterium]|nr:hypothetical protein [Bacteroidia bacterium]
MNRDETLEILQSLALGVDPETGEVLEKDHFINSKQVHTALLLALHAVESQAMDPGGELIPEAEVKEAKKALRKGKYAGNPNQLMGFFLGTRRFKHQETTSHPLYGRYDGMFSQGQLLDYFGQPAKKPQKGPEPWANLDFFEKETFNRFSEKARLQLRERVDALPMVKTEVSAVVAQLREKHRRSHEPWSKDEDYLFTQALKYTNDLKFLTQCFGRSKAALEVKGKRFLYENPDFLTS